MRPSALSFDQRMSFILDHSSASRAGTVLHLFRIGAKSGQTLLAISDAISAGSCTVSAPTRTETEHSKLVKIDFGGMGFRFVGCSVGRMEQTAQLRKLRNQRSLTVSCYF